MRRSTRWTLLVCGLVIVCGISMRWLHKPPLLDNIPLSRAVFDRHDRLLQVTLAADGQYRLFVPRDHVAPALIEALLLKEDRWFSYHPGINLYALFRAALRTVLHPQQRMGGSTITMQVVRLRDHLDTRSIRGKILQIIQALWLEQFYSKDDILAAYLTLAPCGRNIQGVGAASLIYFHKPPSQLSIPEVLTLAVIPQSPTRRAPDRRDTISIHAITKARQHLFQQWMQKHPSTDSLRAIMQLPLHIESRHEVPFEAPHLAHMLLTRYPAASSIISTIDLNLQHFVELQVRNYVERHRAEGIRNAAVMVVNWETMTVEATVGSADFFDPEIHGQVDGTRARRSPGSALKPFVYGLALAQGIIHPHSLLKDSPTSFGGYDPENFDREFLGPVFATDALVKSRNIPAVALNAQLHHPTFYEFLQHAGIHKLRNAQFYGLSTVLGGAEVTMEELVRLYAMLANGGQLQPLRVITDVPSAGETRQMLIPEASYLVLQMLQQAPPPDSAATFPIGNTLPIAWKTGTSFAHRDAWTVGIAGSYVIAVWIGNFDGKSDPILVGRKAAAPLFFSIARQLPQSATVPAILAAHPPPSLHLRQIEVCAVSGDIPTPQCPRTTTTWFIPGTSPIHSCSIHRRIPIDVATGLRACTTEGRTVRDEVFEFWPSDLAALFRLAGLPHREPPPYAPDCPLMLRTATAHAPEIVSPQSDIAYYLRPDESQAEQIALKAISDAGAHRLYWFINREFLGATPPNHALFWPARPGHWVVRVVDDNGYSDAHTLDVYQAAHAM